MPDESFTILSKQLDEHNQYIRTNIQLLVQWFIFFATANYVVLGYFALKLISPGEFSSRGAFFCTAALFLGVNAIGFILCVRAGLLFRRSEQAVSSLQARLWELLAKAPEMTHLEPSSSEYQKVALLMSITVALMFTTWMGLVWYVSTL